MDSLGFDFRCGLQSETNTSLYCFFGSSCHISPSDAQETCVCAPNYEHDNIIGHFPNCSLPSAFLLAFFVINTLGTVFAITLLAKPCLIQLRSNAKTLARLYLVTILLQWITSLCVFVQRGMYEPGLCFYSVSCICYSYLAAQILWAVLDPIYISTRQSPRFMKIFIYGSFMAAGAVQLIANLISFAYIQESNPRRYNLVVSISFGFIALQLAIVPPLSICAISTFQQVLRHIDSQVNKNLSKNSKNDLLALVDRLKKLKQGLFFLWIVNAPMFVAALVLWILQSLPFMYLCFMSAHISLWSNALWFVTFLVPKKESSSAAAVVVDEGTTTQ